MIPLIRAVIYTDYYKIGQRIRRIRKARGFSQDELAERAGISTTHMSHIETGNTKLSLLVFVNIAEALEVQTDILLYEPPQDTTNRCIEEIASMMNGCDAKQARIISESLKAIKQALDIYS